MAGKWLAVWRHHQGEERGESKHAALARKHVPLALVVLNRIVIHYFFGRGQKQNMEIHSFLSLSVTFWFTWHFCDCAENDMSGKLFLKHAAVCGSTDQSHMFSFTAASWVISPLLSGGVSVVIFLIIKKLVLIKVSMSTPNIQKALLSSTIVPIYYRKSWHIVLYYMYVYIVHLPSLSLIGSILWYHSRLWTFSKHTGWIWPVLYAIENCKTGFSDHHIVMGSAR